ncbi:hypothetical protein BGZ54_006976 [Gamsiella multidivaricata]|nr:hypothetical protein BGZ54_006976 [Gamsiella multidivaricata]
MSMESIHDFQFDTAMQLARRKIKVMIVDDNSINLSILSRMLKVHFSETVELVAVMTSGLDALDRLNQEQIDLILMDIDMPVLTGVETTVAIRQITSEYPILKENQKVPIIAVTTSDHAVQREMYQRVGMCDCVSKPISLSKLRLAIENAITLMGHIAPG